MSAPHERSAVDDGFTFEVPVRTYGLNARMHWAKKARITKRQRETVHLAWVSGGSDEEPPADQWEHLQDIYGRFEVVLTRISPQRFKDNDNLVGSLKAVRDGVADCLGIDDGDDRLTWIYEQENSGKRGYYSVRVTVRASE